MQNKHYSKAAFTLFEVLIAITIIAILGSVVGLKLIDIPRKSRVDAAKMQLANFKSAVQFYINDNRLPPTQRQGLEALVEKPDTTPIPANYPPNGYLESRSVPLDPWGNEYVYLCPGTQGEAFEIISYGEDGEEGGEDYATDLSSIIE